MTEQYQQTTGELDRAQTELVQVTEERDTAQNELAGLREVFRYDKYRTEYAPWAGRKDTVRPEGTVGHRRGPTRRAPERGALVYDETPIGNYLELEGPKPWIDEVAGRLGYERPDYIILSYAALYSRKCREQGNRPANMVFSARQSRRAG